MSTIARVAARRVFDSRGRPTVEAEVTLESGASGRAIAPAGASKGSREAIDLRDGGTRFGGLDVAQAVANVAGPIHAALVGCDAFDQAGVDAKLIALDGTPDKSKLGGNAIVAVSLAVAHAAANARQVPLWKHLAGASPVCLPLPEVQILGGGAHAARALDVQDVMVMPVGAWTFPDGIAIVAEVYRCAGELLLEQGMLAGVADEGGYWPRFATHEAAFDLVLRAVERAGLAPGSDVVLSLDVAATELWRDGHYLLEGRVLDRDALAERLLGWLDHYPIASIEDPFAEDDRVGWIMFMRAVGQRAQVVGDDYLTTNAARINAASADVACNAVLIKPNQAGTLSEAGAAVEAARRANFATIVSARSGETEDTTVAHLAVGWNAGQLKVGAFARGERMAKWNEVLRIADALGPDARYAGTAALPIPWPPR